MLQLIVCQIIDVLMVFNRQKDFDADQKIMSKIGFLATPYCDEGATVIEKSKRTILDF